MVGANGWQMLLATGKGGKCSIRKKRKKCVRRQEYYKGISVIVLLLLLCTVVMTNEFILYRAADDDGGPFAKVRYAPKRSHNRLPGGVPGKRRCMSRILYRREEKNTSFPLFIYLFRFFLFFSAVSPDFSLLSGPFVGPSAK